jgi:hypothetical protein
LENLDAEVDINRAWETVIENIKISAKESLGYCELKKQMVLRIIRSKETCLIAVVTGSKQNKWG